MTEFGKKLGVRIMNNLQVSIKSVHVRYEDGVSDPANPVTGGAILRQLVLESVDRLWNRMSAKELAASAGKSGVDAVIYKLLHVAGLGVYWERGSRSPAAGFLHGKPPAEVRSTMRDMVLDPQLPWLLEPLTIFTKVTLRPEVDFATNLAQVGCR